MKSFLLVFLTLFSFFTSANVEERVQKESYVQSLVDQVRFFYDKKISLEASNVRCVDFYTQEESEYVGTCHMRGFDLNFEFYNVIFYAGVKGPELLKFQLQQRVVFP